MADNNIDLTASFDASNAIKGVKDFGKAADKAVDGVNDSVGDLQKSIVKTSSTKLSLNSSSAVSALDSLKGKILAVGAGMAAYFTVGAVKNFFDAAITGAMGQETAINQLNGALSRTGELTVGRTDEMLKFASSLQSVSTIGDEVALGQLSIARNFTKTDEQARSLVAAAADMSSALGISFETAVDNLNKTMDGTAGRLLETVPALRGVSEEALKSGAAIDIVAKQFAGAATNEIKTFEGALTQLNNSYGDVFESFGLGITQSPVIIAAMNELSNAFGKVATGLDGTRDSSISFVNRGIIAIVSGIRDMIPSINVAMSFFKSLGFIFNALVKGVMSFVDSLKLIGNAWLWLVGTINGKQSAIEDMGAALDRMAKRGDELSESLMNIGKDAFTELDLKQFDDALARIQDAANAKPIEIETKISLPDIPDISKIEKKIDVKAEKEIKAEKEKVVKEEKVGDFFPFDTKDELEYAKFIDSFNVFGSAFGSGVQAITIAVGDIVWFSKKVGKALLQATPMFLGGIQGLIAAMGEGAEGARKAIPDVLAKITSGIGAGVGSIWGTLGSKIGEGIGGIVGEQIKMAAQPIGDTLKAIDEFMAEVPNVLKRITDNLPTIMNKVFENLPDLLIAIFKALPAIMRASASAMKPLFKELGKESNAIAQTLLEVLYESIAMVFMAIGYAAQGALIGLQQLWKEKLNAAFDKLLSVFTSIFDGTFLQDIKNAFINGFGGLFDGTFLQNVRDIFTNAFGGLFDGTFLQNIRDGVKDAFKNGLGGLFDGTFEKNVKDIFINGFGGLFNGTFEKNIKDAFINGFGGLFDGTFEKNIKDIFKNAFGGLFTEKFWKDVGQAIVDGFKELFEKLNPAELIKGSGEGGKTGGEVAVNLLTGGLLAKGGVVPPGYPDDKYPAMLTSNEVVVPAGTAPNLFSLIDRLASGTAPNNQTNNETNDLLRQLITVMMNQQTQVDVKIDRDTLARAILSLNKDNRRLA